MPSRAFVRLFINNFTGHQNPSSTYTGNSDINTSNANSVTLTAAWEADVPSIPTGACTGSYGSQRNVNLAVNGAENFDYTGNVVCAYLQKTGYYKLEVWGAQGGYNNYNTGGRGGYSYGNIYTSGLSSLYIVVGQFQQLNMNGTYNGGGGTDNSGNPYPGGGATHISVYNCGQLRNCSSYKSNILIVAGGGGGTGTFSTTNQYLTYNEFGGSGGGYIGGLGNRGGSYNSKTRISTGGSQTEPGYNIVSDESTYNARRGGFGYGGTGLGQDGGGGGGGWYGGGGSYGANAGGGSGYIGNSLLLQNKGMYQHDNGYTVSYSSHSRCSNSTAAATKTTCTSSAGHAVANAANTGNGYAKITYLGT